jgi:outer membrane protein assembly factor BamD
MRRPLAALLAIVALAALSACSTKYTTAGGKLKTAPTPEENYERGLAELKAKNYPEALRFFEYVKAKYPYSDVSAKCDLRVADIKLSQDQAVEAAAAYGAFQKDHPTSEDFDYAKYRQALALYKSTPNDFVLFPPAYEKDQKEAEKAAALARELEQKDPPSALREDAAKLRAQIDDRLSRREWFVAEYYYKQGRWAGAAGRYQGLVHDYPASPRVPEALVKLARSYARLDEKFLARQALQELVAHHAEAPERPEAEKLLESLR